MCKLNSFFHLQSLSCCSVEEDSNFGQSTALVEACRNRDVPLVDLLLKHGARDDDCKALSVTVQNRDETLIAKLLSTKVKCCLLLFECVSSFIQFIFQFYLFLL